MYNQSIHYRILIWNNLIFLLIHFSSSHPCKMNTELTQSNYLSDFHQRSWTAARDIYESWKKIWTNRQGGLLSSPCVLKLYWHIINTENKIKKDESERNCACPMICLTDPPPSPPPPSCLQYIVQDLAEIGMDNYTGNTSLFLGRDVITAIQTHNLYETIALPYWVFFHFVYDWLFTE